MFGQFAKGLGRQIDACKQGVACIAPRLSAALQHGNLPIAQRGKASGGAFCHTGACQIAAVVHHHAHLLARCQAGDFQLQSAVGQRRGIKQVRLAVLAGFAHVEQGNFLAVMQPGLED